MNLRINKTSTYRFIVSHLVALGNELISSIKTFSLQQLHWLETYQRAGTGAGGGGGGAGAGGGGGGAGMSG